MKKETGTYDETRCRKRKKNICRTSRAPLVECIDVDNRRHR